MANITAVSSQMFYKSYKPRLMSEVLRHAGVTCEKEGLANTSTITVRILGRTTYFWNVTSVLFNVFTSM